MHVTVAICTWNRARLLDITLTSLGHVSIPVGVSWDVVVADNNSTDETEAVLDQYSGRLPLRRVFVPQQGKSHALNEVVARLAGDLVLWTDDDVLFDENWIASYVAAARYWPQASFFGGQVIPRFLAEEPAWLRPAWPTVSSVYAARELGDEPFVFDHKRLPFGANMAVRVAVQKRYRFDPQLGRRGGLLLAGEETELMKQWLVDGHIGMWVPSSRVDHLITPDRLELDHIRRFFYSLALTKQSPGSSDAWPLRWLRGCWYVSRALKYQSLRAVDPRAGEPRRAIKYLTRTSYCWGRVRAEWGCVPSWLMSSAVRRIKRDPTQPRVADGLPIVTAAQVIRPQAA